MTDEHCSCSAINHRHLAGGCDEPKPHSPTATICETCRFWEAAVAHGPHLTCSACGGTIPVEPHDSVEYHGRP